MSESPARTTGGLTPLRLLAHVGIGAAAVVVVAGLCSLVGHWRLTPETWVSRLWRLGAAAIVGASLAAAGMALQALLRNPLAEPYILGVSSGAGIGVLLGIVFVERTAASYGLTRPLLAFAGALGACAVVYGVAQRRGRLDPYSLLLSGVIVNAFNGAVMLLIYLMARPADIREFAHWGMGRISDVPKPELMGVCLLAVLFGWAVLLLRGAAFNALSLGDDVARSAGVSVALLRVETFVFASLMTAAAVALAGPIGFVGLIVPHIARLLVGPDHRRLVIASGFGGAVFLMLADTACRTWVGTQMGEIPVGVITAFLGGPFFIWLLRRKRGGGQP